MLGRQDTAIVDEGAFTSPVQDQADLQWSVRPRCANQQAHRGTCRRSQLMLGGVGGARSPVDRSERGC